MATGQIVTRILLVRSPPELDAWLLYEPEFVFAYLAYANALFGFRIFDPVPLARQTAIDQMHTGMLVLVHQGQVASMNPSAERILGISTQQKQAQEQILEQQRVLAALREREQLARELHDSIGQVMGYAGFQLEAASKKIRDGKGDAAVSQLDRLADVFRDHPPDVREYILNLRSGLSLHQPFLEALQQYLQGFTSNYDI